VFIESRPSISRVVEEVGSVVKVQEGETIEVAKSTGEWIELCLGVGVGVSKDYEGFRT
jgi:hypothetical protein